MRTPSNIGIVYVPGFASLPPIQSRGVLGRVAEETACDFTRFCYADIVEKPDKLTYSAMVAGAATLIERIPNPHVVIAASSLGAGMLPWIVAQVQRINPRKICGVFGWAAVSPACVAALLKKSPDFEAFLAGGVKGLLTFQPPTMSAPFEMNLAQYHDIASFDEQRYEKLALTPLPEDSVCLLWGRKDPVARAVDSRRIMEKLSLGPARVFPYAGGHRPPEGMIEAGLRSVIAQARRNASAQAVRTKNKPGPSSTFTG